MKKFKIVCEVLFTMVLLSIVCAGAFRVTDLVMIFLFNGTVPKILTTIIGVFVCIGTIIGLDQFKLPYGDVDNSKKNSQRGELNEKNKI